MSPSRLHFPSGADRAARSTGAAPTRPRARPDGIRGISDYGLCAMLESLRNVGNDLACASLMQRNCNTTVIVAA